MKYMMAKSEMVMETTYYTYARSTASPMTPAPALLSPTAILIMGQDPILRQSIDALLVEQQVELITVHTSAAALGALLNRAVAAFVINLTCLGMDGYRICSEIRNQSLVPIYYNEQ
jgi:CheY-like chemotaxis protein